MPGSSAAPGPFVDDYLLYLMARASALTSAGFHNQVRALGIQVYEWRIMAVLYGTDGVTVGGLPCPVMTAPITDSSTTTSEKT